MAIMMISLFLLPGFAVIAEEAEKTQPLPILLYHSIDETGGPYSVTREKFERDMDSLLEAGYTPVSFHEVIAFVHRGEPLPEKPVVITFDDGYKNNYAVAYPVAKEKNIKIEVFAIVSFLEYSSIAFDWDMAKAMEESGLVNIGSHTFMLHSDEETGRRGMGIIEGEPFRWWEHLVRKDLAFAKRFLIEGIGETPMAFAYPFGNYSTESERILRESGYVLSVTTEPGIGQIKRGDLESLYLLPRISMDAEAISAAEKIETFRDVRLSEKTLDCKNKLWTEMYASRFDALSVLYSDALENADVNMSGLAGFVDTPYLAPDKAKILALGVNRGIIRGFPDYTLGPDCYVTRGEFAVMLTRSAEASVDAKVLHSFPDSEAWNAPALSWCAEKGYMIGYTDGTFGTQDFLTKKQLELIYSRIKESNTDEKGQA